LTEPYVVSIQLLLRLLAGVVFTLLLVLACASDVRSRRIPNTLVLWTAVLGVSYSLAVVPGVHGALRAAGGMSVGLMIWLPFCALRMLGEGDVKFFAAASAWLGPTAAVQAAMLSVIFGGLLALVWLAGGRRWMPELGQPYSTVLQPEGSGELPVADRRRQLPYGLAMAAGLAVAAWIPSLPS
jgi:prepilin peptidase CpaA